MSTDRADRYAARREKLLHSLKKKGIPAFLISSETNVSYLTGFTGDSSFLLLERDKGGNGRGKLISDGRYTTQIASECPDLDVHIRPQKETVVEATAKMVKQAKLQKLAIEAEHFSVAALEKLKEGAKTVEIAALSGLVEELREVKDAGEIAEIRRAIHQAERGFDVLRAQIVGSMTELEGAHLLEQAMRQVGANVAAFPPIVAVGPRAALPHARPTEGRISESDFVLVDWGARSTSGYHSDLTRILVTGKIPPKLEKVYGVVLKAQQAAIQFLRAGVRCCDVDAVARRVIEKAGFGKQFNHGLGHGIGLNIHERPRLSAASEAKLKPGMVVTVEPGIYIEAWGGVRIEDDCLVTREGCEVLTSVAREFSETLVH